jgi:hypothetical protein
MVAAKYAGYNGLVAAFSNPILLQCIGHSDLMFNAALSQVKKEFLGHVFPTTVAMKALDAAARLSFDPRYKLLEEVENLRLGTHEIDQGVVGIIICKDDEIRVASGGRDIDRSPNIRVYKLSRGRGTTHRGREG